MSPKVDKPALPRGPRFTQWGGDSTKSDIGTGLELSMEPSKALIYKDYSNGSIGSIVFIKTVSRFYFLQKVKK